MFLRVAIIPYGWTYSIWSRLSVTRWGNCVLTCIWIVQLIVCFLYSCKHILCVPKGGKGKLCVGSAWRRKGNWAKWLPVHGCHSSVIIEHHINLSYLLALLSLYVTLRVVDFTISWKRAYLLPCGTADVVVKNHDNRYYLSRIVQRLLALYARVYPEFFCCQYLKIKLN